MNQSSKKPRFSIITVSYNHEQFIDQTIESVINQTYQDFEYLIVDGKSTDNSKKVIEKYSKNLKIKPIYQESNEGAVSSLNEGFKNATGEILCYINSDDFFLKEALQEVENIFVNNPSIDLIYGNAYMVSDKNIILRDFISKNFSFKRLKINECHVCQQATFFRKKIFDQTNGFNPKNKRSWDFELFTDMIKAGARFKRINNVLACFRVHGNTITSKGNNENRKENREHIYNKYFSKPLTFGEKVEKIIIYLSDRLNFKFIFYRLKILYYKLVRFNISDNEKKITNSFSRLFKK